MNSTHITKKIFIAIIFIGLCTGAGWAAEDLFLADCWGGSTDIYRVDLDSVSGHGDLTLIRNVPVTESYALACTPDGERCYAIGKWSGEFGYLDLGDNGWYTLPNIVDSEGYIVQEIVLAAFNPYGALYVASQGNETIYFIDTETGVATEVGQVEEDLTRGTIVDIGGADMAFKADGQLCLWTNSTQTMYSLQLPVTYPGVVIATEEFVNSGTFVTGLAIRANGYGGPVGSQRDPASEFIVTDGAPFQMYLNGQPFTHGWGDMANGLMPPDVCTFTIGYYKNHSWDEATVDICGVTVDEGMGKAVLKKARGNNFSMLFAQLIAAKLNVGYGGSISEIDDAEAWLCQQENAFDGVELFWHADFYDKAQKAEANSFMVPLDDFNNSNHCDD